MTSVPARKMPVPVRKRRGAALIIVLASLLVLVALLNLVLGMVSSQSRLTHHQVSRVQAYYAAMAGVNLANERLRLGDWTVGADCASTNCCSAPCLLTVEDANFATTFPASVSEVQIRILPPAHADCVEPQGAEACISATALFTYSTSPS